MINKKIEMQLALNSQPLISTAALAYQGLLEFLSTLV